MSGEHLDLAATAERAVELVTELGGAGAEACASVSRRRHGLTRFANSFVHQHVADDRTELALEVALDGRVTATTTTRIDPDGLRAVVEAALADARAQPVDPTWPGTAPPAALAESRRPTGPEDDLPRRRARVAADFIGADREGAAAGYVDTEHAQVAVATTAGQRVADGATRATVDGIHQRAGAAGASHQTAGEVGELDGVATGARAADLAQRGAGAADLAPGTLPVVLGPEAVATICVFLGVYGFNAKAHLEGASCVRLGEQQLDGALTLRDDATDPRHHGLLVDAEGTPRRPTDLVVDGVSRALAHDRRTAARAGERSTGAALPGGAAMGPVPTSLVLAAGDADEAELCARIGDGLLVTQFHYCRVLDPKSLQVTGLTRNGTFRVSNGRIGEPVGNLRFTQSFVDALGPGRVLGVGGDARSAAGEFGPDMAVCPSLALAGWRFTGGAQG